MSDDSGGGCGCLYLLIAIGVFAAVAGAVGGAWAVLYAMFWPVWVAYRVALWLLAGG